jgi:hypothetical protein
MLATRLDMALGTAYTAYMLEVVEKQGVTPPAPCRWRFLISWVASLCMSMSIASGGQPVAEKAAPVPPGPRVVEKTVIDTVWPGHPVGFALLTHDEQQWVAYYDAERHMTVAGRKLGETEWTRTRLPSRLGWDSHNYISMTLDRDQHIHLSGNLHCDPLVYFRSEKPLDPTSLRPIHRMTGELENRVTYPRFFHDQKGRLLFFYRDGGSGNGQEFVNVYDEAKQVWRRLLDAPLFNGRDHSMSAYYHGPQRGPDGRFHMVWMWRDTPDCRTNHSLSYARSQDLVTWENAAGKPIELPITPDHRELIVEPTPTRTGLINTCFGLGFDPKHRPIVHYHYYDANGHSQIFASRWEGKSWVRYQVSQWEHRWDFGGGGSIKVALGAQAVREHDKQHLAQSWWHRKHGAGIWKLDAETLQIVGSVEPPRFIPAELAAARTAFGEEPIHVHWRSAPAGRPGETYWLRWETLSTNRDGARPAAPEPGPLELYRVRQVPADPATAP